MRFVENIDRILNYIDEHDDFIVTSHVNPDGDNIGSSLGMYYFVKKLGKKVAYVLNDEYPNNLMYLYDENIKKISSDIDERGQIVIALDSGDYSRICIDEDILVSSKEIICIDHHSSNQGYGNLQYIDSKASSTCELVYNVIKRYEEIKSQKYIDATIATALYTGLVTDTGNFQYSNTESSSFLMASDLIYRGANKMDVVTNIYQSNTLKYYKILGEALNNLEVIDEKIAVMTVSKDMMERNNIDYSDIDSITPYSRDIEGVELGIFIKEKEIGEIKVSLRSKTSFDCTVLAKKFNGGGHMRASGCTILNSNVVDARKMLIEEAKKDLFR